MSVCEVLHTSQAEVTQPHPCASWPIPARQWVATRRRCRGAAQDRLARNKNDFLALLRLQRQLVRALRPLAFDDGPRNDSRTVCYPSATKLRQQGEREEGAERRSPNSHCVDVP